MNEQEIVETTQRWIASMVIGLNLCPFAQRVFREDQIRYAVSDATDAVDLLEDLTHELVDIASCPSAEVETTLLIHPFTLTDFLDFNDFLATADQLVEDLGLRGVIQLASFHPRYQFARTQPDDVENYTNRSPYPMLHLLREESITAVAHDPDELLAIPRRNVELLRQMGLKGVLERLRAADCLPSPPKASE